MIMKLTDYARNCRGLSPAAARQQALSHVGAPHRKPETASLTASYGEERTRLVNEFLNGRQTRTVTEALPVLDKQQVEVGKVRLLWSGPAVLVQMRNTIGDTRWKPAKKVPPQPREILAALAASSEPKLYAFAA